MRLKLAVGPCPIPGVMESSLYLFSLVTCSLSYVGVTQSLFTALYYLRDETFARLLWVDAICVNQRGPDEKSGQISLMKNNYNDTRNLTVWLSEEDDTSSTAFEAIRNEEHGMTCQKP
jgi:hypothetical protein